MIEVFVKLNCNVIKPYTNKFVMLKSVAEVFKFNINVAFF